MRVRVRVQGSRHRRGCSGTATTRRSPRWETVGGLAEAMLGLDGLNVTRIREHGGMAGRQISVSVVVPPRLSVLGWGGGRGRVGGVGGCIYAGDPVKQKLR